MSNPRRYRRHICALVSAHGAFTEAVARAAQLMISGGHDKFADHLDGHRGELNVAIGEFGLWTESFGDWARVDVGQAIYPSAVNAAAIKVGSIRLGRDLFLARERLKSRRTDVLAALADAREVLGEAGLPIDELTAYRRTVRLWAGEAIDLVTAAHRLALAEQYIRSFGDLRADPDRDASTDRRGVTLLRQWMGDLEQADREDELMLAHTCGYGDFVECYRTETLS